MAITARNTCKSPARLTAARGPVERWRCEHSAQPARRHSMVTIRNYCVLPLTNYGRRLHPGAGRRFFCNIARVERRVARILWISAGLAVACSIVSSAASAQGQLRFAGIAAYYSKDYKGRTASGDHYDPQKFTAAHRTLPFGTRLRVTDPKTQRSVVVVVNDRGPFTKGRVIDLSLAAAKALRMTDRGLIKVTAVADPSVTSAAKSPAH
jgi:rare lipoprotein A